MSAVVLGAPTQTRSKIIFGLADVNVRYGVGSSSDSLVARLAVPDSDRVSLDGCLSAEGADVFGVLGDLHLLHLFAKGGTVSVIQEERGAEC
jgi:hypothetical protein